jgi:hypothetical protein
MAFFDFICIFRMNLDAMIFQLSQCFSYSKVLYFEKSALRFTIHAMLALQICERTKDLHLGKPFLSCILKLFDLFRARSRLVHNLHEY